MHCLKTASPNTPECAAGPAWPAQEFTLAVSARRSRLPLQPLSRGFAATPPTFRYAHRFLVFVMRPTGEASLDPVSGDSGPGAKTRRALRSAATQSHRLRELCGRRLGSFPMWKPSSFQAEIQELLCAFTYPGYRSVFSE